MTIWFDMDGTIANLYAVEDWLPKLQASDPSPYRDAAVMVNMSMLARRLNQLRRIGYKIGIISWLSKGSDEVYDTDVTAAKLNWLQQHLPSVMWDYINIVPYGTPKHKVCGEGCLFDDEAENRENWDCGDAYNVDNILGILRDLVKG